jgi:hypothetical protein
LPDQTRIQRGRDFESRVTEVLGGSLVPGSGSGWRSKSDVKSGSLLLSAKAEKSRTWGRTREQLREAIDLTLGTGRIPGLAVLEDDGAELVVMRMSDLALALSQGVGVTPGKSNGELRRERANTPALLREEP